jgi:hypothetical protein
MLSPVMVVVCEIASKPMEIFANSDEIFVRSPKPSVYVSSNLSPGSERIGTCIEFWNIEPMPVIDRDFLIGKWKGCTVATVIREIHRQCKLRNQ